MCGSLDPLQRANKGGQINFSDSWGFGAQGSAFW
jgi:hypothetical protein